MEKTAPVAPQKINLFLKILIYPNASAYKITYASDKNYYSKLFAIASILASEVLILNYGLPEIKGYAFSRTLFLFVIIHGIPLVFLEQKVTQVSQNYYSYYNKFLYYLFLIFLVVGLILFGINMYEGIGK